MISFVSRVGTASLSRCEAESLRRSGAEQLEHAAVLVLGARLANGELSDSLVRHVRAARPYLTIVVCGFRRDCVPGLQRSFAVAGADEYFAVQGDDGNAALAALIRRRLLAPAPQHVLHDAVHVLAEGEGRTMVLWCLRNSYRKRCVDDVARHFAIDRKTASRRCRRGGAPSLSVLLRLGRLYHAAELRRKGIFSQDEIARRLGFSNAIALVMFRARARKAHLSLGWDCAASPWGRLR